MNNKNPSDLTSATPTIEPPGQVSGPLLPSNSVSPNQPRLPVQALITKQAEALAEATRLDTSGTSGKNQLYFGNQLGQPLALNDNLPHTITSKDNPLRQPEGSFPSFQRVPRQDFVIRLSGQNSIATMVAHPSGKQSNLHDLAQQQRFEQEHSLFQPNQSITKSQGEDFNMTNQSSIGILNTARLERNAVGDSHPSELHDPRHFITYIHPQDPQQQTQRAQMKLYLKHRKFTGKRFKKMAVKNTDKERQREVQQQKKNQSIQNKIEQDLQALSRDLEETHKISQSNHYKSISNQPPSTQLGLAKTGREIIVLSNASVAPKDADVDNELVGQMQSKSSDPPKIKIPHHKPSQLASSNMGHSIDQSPFAPDLRPEKNSDLKMLGMLSSDHDRRMDTLSDTIKNADLNSSRWGEGEIKPNLSVMKNQALKDLQRRIPSQVARKTGQQQIKIIQQESPSLSNGSKLTQALQRKFQTNMGDVETDSHKLWMKQIELNEDSNLKEATIPLEGQQPSLMMEGSMENPLEKLDLSQFQPNNSQSLEQFSKQVQVKNFEFQELDPSNLNLSARRNQILNETFKSKNSPISDASKSFVATSFVSGNQGLFQTGGGFGSLNFKLKQQKNSFRVTDLNTLNNEKWGSLDPTPKPLKIEQVKLGDIEEQEVNKKFRNSFECRSNKRSKKQSTVESPRGDKDDHHTAPKPNEHTFDICWISVPKSNLQQFVLESKQGGLPSKIVPTSIDPSMLSIKHSKLTEHLKSNLGPGRLMKKQSSFHHQHTSTQMAPIEQSPTSSPIYSQEQQEEPRTVQTNSKTNPSFEGVIRFVNAQNKRNGGSGLRFQEDSTQLRRVKEESKDEEEVLLVNPSAQEESRQEPTIQSRKIKRLNQSLNWSNDKKLPIIETEQDQVLLTGGSEDGEDEQPGDAPVEQRKARNVRNSELFAAHALEKSSLSKKKSMLSILSRQTSSDGIGGQARNRKGIKVGGSSLKNEIEPRKSQGLNDDLLQIYQKKKKVLPRPSPHASSRKVSPKQALEQKQLPVNSISKFVNSSQASSTFQNTVAAQAPTLHSMNVKENEEPPQIRVGGTFVSPTSEAEVHHAKSRDSSKEAGSQIDEREFGGDTVYPTQGTNSIQVSSREPGLNRVLPSWNPQRKKLAKSNNNLRRKKKPTASMEQVPSVVTPQNFNIKALNQIQSSLASEIRLSQLLNIQTQASQSMANSNLPTPRVKNSIASSRSKSPPKGTGERVEISSFPLKISQCDQSPVKQAASTQRSLQEQEMKIKMNEEHIHQLQQFIKVQQELMHLFNSVQPGGLSDRLRQNSQEGSCSDEDHGYSFNIPTSEVQPKSPVRAINQGTGYSDYKNSTARKDLQEDSIYREKKSSMELQQLEAPLNIESIKMKGKIVHPSKPSPQPPISSRQAAEDQQSTFSFSKQQDALVQYNSQYSSLVNKTQNSGPLSTQTDQTLDFITTGVIPKDKLISLTNSSLQNLQSQKAGEKPRSPPAPKERQQLHEHGRYFSQDMQSIFDTLGMLRSLEQTAHQIKQIQTRSIDQSLSNSLAEPSSYLGGGTLGQSLQEPLATHNSLKNDSASAKSPRGTELQPLSVSESLADTGQFKGILENLKRLREINLLIFQMQCDSNQDLSKALTIQRHLAADIGKQTLTDRKHYPFRKPVHRKARSNARNKRQPTSQERQLRFSIEEQRRIIRELREQWLNSFSEQTLGLLESQTLDKGMVHLIKDVIGLDMRHFLQSGNSLKNTLKPIDLPVKHLLRVAAKPQKASKDTQKSGGDYGGAISKSASSDNSQDGPIVSTSRDDHKNIVIAQRPTYRRKQKKRSEFFGGDKQNLRNSIQNQTEKYSQVNSNDARSGEAKFLIESLQDLESHVTQGTILFENMTHRGSTQHGVTSDGADKAAVKAGGVSNSVTVEPSQPKDQPAPSSLPQNTTESQVVLLSNVIEEEKPEESKAELLPNDESAEIAKQANSFQESKLLKQLGFSSERKQDELKLGQSHYVYNTNQPGNVKKVETLMLPSKASDTPQGLSKKQPSITLLEQNSIGFESESYPQQSIEDPSTAQYQGNEPPSAQPENTSHEPRPGESMSRVSHPTPAQNDQTPIISTQHSPAISPPLKENSREVKDNTGDARKQISPSLCYSFDKSNTINNPTIRQTSPFNDQFKTQDNHGPSSLLKMEKTSKISNQERPHIQQIIDGHHLKDFASPNRTQYLFSQGASTQRHGLFSGGTESLKTSTAFQPYQWGFDKSPRVPPPEGSSLKGERVFFAGGGVNSILKDPIPNHPVLVSPTTHASNVNITLSKKDSGSNLNEIYARLPRRKKGLQVEPLNRDEQDLTIFQNSREFKHSTLQNSLVPNDRFRFKLFNSSVAAKPKRKKKETLASLGSPVGVNRIDLNSPEEKWRYALKSQPRDIGALQATTMTNGLPSGINLKPGLMGKRSIQTTRPQKTRNDKHLMSHRMQLPVLSSSQANREPKKVMFNSQRNSVIGEEGDLGMASLIVSSKQIFSQRINDDLVKHLAKQS